MSGEVHPAWVDELSGFIFHQLREEYGLGVDEFIATQTLLLELAKRDAVPRSAEGLAAVLSPILCTTKREQEALPQKIELWLQANQPVPEEPDPPEEPLPPELGLHKVVIMRRLLIGLAVLVALGAGAYAYWDTIGPTLALVPPPEAAASADNKEGGTGTRARGEELAPETGVVRLNELEISPEEDGALLRTLGIVAAVLAGILALRQLLSRWQGRRFLNRVRNPDDVYKRALALQDQSEEAERQERYLVAARHLRARQASYQVTLDVERSVAASARAGGTPQQVFRQRTELPEYLCLLDQRSSKDHAAVQISKHLDGIQSNSVFLNRFRFDRDPRVCREVGGPRNGRVAKLTELTSLYPGHHLMIFSDGRGLFDSVTGTLAHFTEEFRAFRSATLLTPEPVSSWGYREDTLSTARLQVLPVSVDALAGVRSPNAAKKVRAEERLGPPLPATLEQDERRWLHDESPDEAFVLRGFAGTKRYLGPEGFLWLCTCAVYPEIQPLLTRRLGRLLSEEGLGEDFGHEVELRLSRLPWFRAGRMPNWVRLHLLGSLPASQDARVRAGIQRMMLGVVDPALAGPHHLEVASDEKMLIASVWRRVSRRWKKQRQGPWKDQVFADWTNNRLSFRLHQRIAQALSPVGIVTAGEGEVAPYRTAASMAIATAVFAFLIPIGQLRAWGQTPAIITTLVLACFPAVRHYLDARESRPWARSAFERLLFVLLGVLLVLADEGAWREDIGITLFTFYVVTTPDWMDYFWYQARLVRPVPSRPLYLIPWLAVLASVPLLAFVVHRGPTLVEALQMTGVTFCVFLFVQVALRLPATTRFGRWLVRVMEYCSPGRWLLGPERPDPPQRKIWVSLVDLFVSTIALLGLCLPVFFGAMVREQKRTHPGQPLRLVGVILAGAVVAVAAVAAAAACLELTIYSWFMSPEGKTGVQRWAALSAFVGVLAGLVPVKRSAFRARPGVAETILDKLGPVRLWQTGPRRMIPLLFIPLCYPFYVAWVPTALSDLEVGTIRQGEEGLITVGATVLPSTPRPRDRFMMALGSTCLQVGPAQAPGASSHWLEQASCERTKPQIWFVQLLTGKGEVTVSSLDAGPARCLEASEVGRPSGVNLGVLAPCNGSPTQTWRFVSEGSGKVWLKTEAGGTERCLSPWGMDACESYGTWFLGDLAASGPEPSSGLFGAVETELSKSAGASPSGFQVARTPEALAAAVASHRWELARCLEQHGAEPSAGTSPRLHLEISDVGLVTSARLEGDGPTAPLACIKEAAEKWKFPPELEATRLTVPLRLKGQ